MIGKEETDSRCRLAKRVVRQWNRLPKEEVESPPLKVLKDVQCGTVGRGLVADLAVLGDSWT